MKKNETKRISAAHMTAIAAIITAIGGVIAIFYQGNSESSAEQPSIIQTSIGNGSPNISGVGGSVSIEK